MIAYPFPSLEKLSSTSTDYVDTLNILAMCLKTVDKMRRGVYQRERVMANEILVSAI